MRETLADDLGRPATSGPLRDREPWRAISWGELAGLAVHGVLAVPRAVLLQLEPVRVVPTVLAGDVVALLALDARQRDLRSDVGLLGHGWRYSPCADRWRLAPHRLHARTRAGWI